MFSVVQFYYYFYWYEPVSNEAPLCERKEKALPHPTNKIASCCEAYLVTV